MKTNYVRIQSLLDRQASMIQRLYWFNYRQYDHYKQNDDWQFVKPAKPNMAPGIIGSFKLINGAATVKMKN